MSTIYALLSYTFAPSPGKPFYYYLFLLILAALLIAFSVYLTVAVKKAKEDKTFKRTFRKYPANLITIAICLLIYLGARYTQVPFLSARFLLFIVLITLIIIVVRMIGAYMTDYPREKKKHHELMEKNKYIPKKGSGR
jgi:cell division protein FtsW (lipid II flippase)